MKRQAKEKVTGEYRPVSCWLPVQHYEQLRALAAENGWAVGYLVARILDSVLVLNSETKEITRRA